jgi:hypothetical protein
MTKSGKKKKGDESPALIALTIFGICFMIFGIIFGIVSCTSEDSGEFDKYLKKPLKDCPNYTLKEGLDRVD